MGVTETTVTWVTEELGVGVQTTPGVGVCAETGIADPACHGAGLSDGVPWAPGDSVGVASEVGSPDEMGVAADIVVVIAQKLWARWVLETGLGQMLECQVLSQRVKTGVCMAVGREEEVGVGVAKGVEVPSVDVGVGVVVSCSEDAGVDVAVGVAV
eukprot:scaffold42229_cov37-Prasinocladus_malaysianus.AAC.1